MATLVSEATREVDTIATVEMKVQATAPGSFEVFLSLHSELTGVFQLLGPEGLAKVSAASLGIIKIVAESLKLRKLLKGEPPEKTTSKGGLIMLTKLLRIPGLVIPPVDDGSNGIDTQAG